MNPLITNQEGTIDTERPYGVTLIWVLRAILALTVISEALSGDLLNAAETLLALALCTLPGGLLRERGVPFALEAEILFLMMAIGNCTLGVAFNFYRIFPYYDKFLHLINPAALSFYCLLILRSQADTGQTSSSLVALALVAALISLGLSTFWEILEYLSDVLVGSQTQGSPTMSPLDDTMWDLILSFSGALGGAIAAAFPRIPLVSAGYHDAVMQSDPRRRG